jgi:superfamily I DNA and/or RNA helicase
MDARLLDAYGLDKTTATRTLLDHLGDALPSGCYAMLTEQHRMRPEIGSLISDSFYEGKLHSRRNATRHQLEHAITKPVTWLSTSALPNPTETAVKPSFKNIAEVKQCIALVKRIEWVAKVRKTRYSVALLTGYGAQRTELERAVAKIKSDLTCLDVVVQTVDAFQGREADVAIYSVTRSNDQGTAGFLTERRRLNVALSRAREALVIVGDHRFCNSIAAPNPFSDVLHHITSHPSECALEVASDDP